MKITRTKVPYTRNFLQTVLLRITSNMHIAHTPLGDENEEDRQNYFNNGADGYNSDDIYDDGYGDDEPPNYDRQQLDGSTVFQDGSAVQYEEDYSSQQDSQISCECEMYVLLNYFSPQLDSIN